MFDIFNNDAFSVTQLTDAMREIKYVPGFVSSLGIFQSESIDTLSVAIEKDSTDEYSIVPSSPRGSPGDTVGKGRRSLRNLTIPHFQRDDSIMADEVQGIRAFGTERQVELLQSKIARRATMHSTSFALTEEYQRLTLVTQGKIVDKDGTILYNYFSEMGESQAAETDWDLDNTSPVAGSLRQLGTNLVRSIGTELGGLPFAGIIALCGDDFFDALIKHKEVYQTYLNQTAASDLRNSVISLSNQSAATGIWGEVTLWGIRFINYRGGFGVQVAPGEAKFIPLGVPGLFRTVYGPADYIETVNTPGQRLYAKQWRMPNDKGVAMEFQTNVLHYCTRPRVLRSARMT